MAGWDPNSRPVFSSWARMRDENKPEVDWQKVLRAYGSVRMPYATGPTSTLPEDLQDEAAKQQRAKDAAEASGIGDTILRGGAGALGVVGGVFDMGRQLVVGTGAGVFNSVIAPGLDLLPNQSTKSWRTDITGDGIVDSNDTLGGQLTAAINPFDDRQVAGMGTLAPFLNVEDDDRLSTRLLKYTGALAGDLLTDPTIVLGVAGKGVAAANKAAKAGLEATEIATAKLGTEISEDAARSYVAKHFAKQGSDQVIDAARRYGVEATEDGFRAVGRTADDAAQSLADNMSEDTLRKAFGDTLGVEAYSAYRRGGNIPLRRSLESQFGDDVGRSIFNSFSPEVAGKFAAEIPFTKFRTTATDVTGGGQVLERFGAAGRLVEDALVAKHRGLDRFIGKIPAGSNRVLNRAARIAGVEAAGELDATVKQIDVGRYVMAQEASRKAAMEAQGQVRKAFESSQVLINGLRDESGDAAGFDDAVRRFNQVTDLDTIDNEALSIVEANALDATRGIRNAQSLYLDMREKYGHLRQFENVGIIEGERRVITEEGLKYLEDIGPGTVKMRGTGRFKSRDAFYDMDQITGEKVWKSTGEINDDLGFKFFEDDVFKAHTIYMKRLETVAGTVAHEDVLRRAGVVSRLASESTAGTMADAATRAATTIERQDADLEERLASSFPGAAKDATRVADSDLSVAQRVAKESYKENKARAIEKLLGEQAPELAARRASVEAARERLWDAATREVQEAAVEREVLDELRAFERELKEALKISREESRRLRKEDLVAAKAEIETKKAAVIEVEAEAKRLSDELEQTRQRLADLERSRKTLRQKDRRARKREAKESDGSTYADMAQTDDGVAADKLGRNIRQLRKVEKVKMETDVINGARVQAAKDELGMAEVRRDLLRDKNFKTEYDAAADDIEKEIWQVKAEIVRIGTKTDIDQLEKMAIAGLKKTFKKEELDPLARLESSQKQARKDLRSGVTPVEGQGVAESIADRRSLVKELSEDLYGYNQQRKSIAESILGDAGVTSGEKLDEVIKAIDDAPLTASAREIIDGQIAARREEVIFLDDVLSDLSNPGRQLRAVLDAASTTRGQDGAWIKSMEATILAIQEAMTSQQGRYKQLLSIDAQRARAQKLTLDAADDKALDKVRIRIQERINELGVYGSMNDDETRRLFERLMEIQERMAIRIAKESDSINYRDYASVLEEQTNVALKSREMREVAEVVAKDRREIERLAAMTEDAFSLETSDAFANERLRAQLVTGKAERVGSVKIKGQVVTVPEYMRDWIVSPAIAEAMARQHRILTNPNATIGGWRMALHALESDWKMMATVMRGPSFVIRNAFGGIYNAMLGGTAGGDFAMGFRYQKALDKAMDNANKASFGSVSGERMTSNNMLTYLDDFIKKELDYEVLPGVKMFDIHKQMEARGIFGSGYMSVIDSDDPYSRLVTEFGKGFRNSAAGVNRADLNLSEKVLYQASDKLANNRYTRSMGSFQDRTERFLRSSQYIAGIRRSGDTEAGHLWADSMVRMTQFDYSDLSDFEKRYLKHVFPFFTFTRNNLPLQVRSFVMRPGVPMTVLRMNNYANEYFGSQNEELNGFLNENMPDWLREAGAWPSMFGSEDEPIAFGMGAPLIDINRYFDLENIDSVGDILTTPLRMAGGFAEEGAAQMNPALKIGVEAATGTNVFTGSKYRDTVGSPFMRALLPDKGVDEKTLQPTQSGFAQQTLRNLFPILGQAERLAPWGPFESEKYQDRWVTSILGSGIGLSGAPVGPLATMTNDQVAGQAAQNTEEIQKEINKKFASAGLDYGAIADWRSKNKMVPWAAIAQAIRQGNPRFYSEGARLALGESGALPKNTQKELEELLTLLENAQG